MNKECTTILGVSFSLSNSHVIYSSDIHRFLLVNTLRITLMKGAYSYLRRLEICIWTPIFVNLAST